MAREYARLLVRIWDDPDWLNLTSNQQITYLALLSSRDLSWCGVAPLLPKRLAGSSTDLTEGKVRKALDELANGPGRLLVADEGTAEVAVRSFVRHDGILKQPNVTKAMVRAIPKVRSKIIQQAITVELGRKFGEDPDLKGWDTLRAEDPELFAKVSENPSANPFGNPSRKAG
jgi:hypothetical protein